MNAQNPNMDDFFRYLFGGNPASQGDPVNDPLKFLEGLLGNSADTSGQANLANLAELFGTVMNDLTNNKTTQSPISEEEVKDFTEQLKNLDEEKLQDILRKDEREKSKKNHPAGKARSAVKDAKVSHGSERSRVEITLNDGVKETDIEKIVLNAPDNLILIIRGENYFINLHTPYGETLNPEGASYTVEGNTLNVTVGRNSVSFVIPKEKDSKPVPVSKPSAEDKEEGIDGFFEL